MHVIVCLVSLPGYGQNGGSYVHGYRKHPHRVRLFLQDRVWNPDTQCPHERRMVVRTCQPPYIQGLNVLLKHTWLLLVPSANRIVFQGMSSFHSFNFNLFIFVEYKVLQTYLYLWSPHFQWNPLPRVSYIVKFTGVFGTPISINSRHKYVNLIFKWKSYWEIK